MEHCSGIANLMVPGTKLQAAEQDERLADVPYRELVGLLLHLSNTWGPDITFAVGYLSRFLDKFGSKHWKAAERSTVPKID